MRKMQRWAAAALMSLLVLPALAQDDFVPEGAVRIDELAEGELRFDSGAVLRYPEGWTIYSEQGYIQASAQLLYGESVFNYQSQLVITINDASSFPIEQGRQVVFGMSAMLYTGREDFDEGRDILTETLEDGRVIEYVDTSAAELLLGNSIIVPLDARYWAWLMFTNVATEGGEERLAEVLDMARTIALELPSNVIVYEGFNLVPQDADCTRALTTSDVNQEVPYALFTCPSGCLARNELGSLWGTDIYTLDSGICTAALHAGVIQDAEGGAILTTWQPGQESYLSTERNGIISGEWGSWGDSFIVEAVDLEALRAASEGDDAEATPDGADAGDCVPPQDGTWAYTPLPIETNTCPSMILALFNAFNAAQTQQLSFGSPFDPRSLMVANADEAAPGEMTIANPATCVYTATYSGTEGEFIYTWNVRSASQVEGLFDFTFAEDLNCRLVIPFTLERTGN